MASRHSCLSDETPEEEQMLNVPSSRRLPAVMEKGQARQLSHMLGVFSIGLGLIEVLAPRGVTRFLGMRGSEPLFRACGLREIASGLGILSARNPAPWIWSRVGGDALDSAVLLAGLRSDNPKRANAGLALAAVVGITALDAACAQALRAGHSSRRQGGRDYSDRSGFPRAPELMRGAAVSDNAIRPLDSSVARAAGR
jgi:hypothetical protein